MRKKSWRWKLVCCGDRNRAFTAFRAECSRRVPGVLLADSESPVRTSPQAHLAATDEWDLNGADPDRVHLMVQVMETWIVADPEALDNGQGFRANVLPASPNLEEVDKATVADSLRRATERTQKGRYHKIRQLPIFSRGSTRRRRAAIIANACSLLSAHTSRQGEESWDGGTGCRRRKNLRPTR